jgi:hypothetical protein
MILDGDFRKVLRKCAAIVLIACGAPIAARACTCAQSPPGQCPGVQTGETIFLGTVTDVGAVASTEASAPANAPMADATGGPIDQIAARVTRYHFHIDESFAIQNVSESAAPLTEIDIFSGGRDGDCGYRFKKGDQYVVFAHAEPDNRLFATICSGTREAAEARALVPQLRAMRDGGRVAAVFGVLRRSDPPFLAPPDDPDDPLGDVTLRLRSKYDRFETSTDADGVYTFYDVHAGEYQFTANLPPQMELTQKTLTGGLPPFDIPDGACYEYDVYALPTGQIRGTVLGPDGKPLSLASVEIYRAGTYSDQKPGLWSFQDSRGYFEFDHIGPGEYTLVYNRTNRKDPNSPYPRTFYPGVDSVSDSQPITLREDQNLSKVNITVGGGYSTRQLRVRLTWEGRKPQGSVALLAKADQGDSPSADEISDGVYEFTLLESSNYTISAYEDITPPFIRPGGRAPACALPARIETPTVTVAGSDTDTKEVLLVFPEPACQNQ